MRIEGVLPIKDRSIAAEIWKKRGDIENKVIIPANLPKGLPDHYRIPILIFRFDEEMMSIKAHYRHVPFSMATDPSFISQIGTAEEMRLQEKSPFLKILGPGQMDMGEKSESLRPTSSNVPGHTDLKVYLDPRLEWKSWSTGNDSGEDHPELFLENAVTACFGKGDWKALPLAS